MFTVVKAVVARENHNRVFGKSKFIQGLQQPAEVVIRGGNAAKIIQVDVRRVSSIRRLFGAWRPHHLMIDRFHLEIWNRPRVLAGESLFGSLRRIGWAM